MQKWYILPASLSKRLIRTFLNKVEVKPQRTMTTGNFGNAEPLTFNSRSKPPYNKFSNFYDARIEMREGCFHSVEHYFQAMKFVDSHQTRFSVNGDLGKISYAKGTWKPAVAKGRFIKSAGSKTGTKKHQLTLRENGLDRNRAKKKMNKALRKKFEKEPFKSLLLSTFERPLVHTPMRGKPDYWTARVDKETGKINGENNMGKLLMEVRTELRELENDEKEEKYEKDNKAKILFDVAAEERDDTPGWSEDIGEEGRDKKTKTTGDFERERGKKAKTAGDVKEGRDNTTEVSRSLDDEIKNLERPKWKKRKHANRKESRGEKRKRRDGEETDTNIGGNLEKESSKKAKTAGDVEERDNKTELPRSLGDEIENLERPKWKKRKHDNRKERKGEKKKRRDGEETDTKTGGDVEIEGGKKAKTAGDNEEQRDNKT